MWARFGRTGYLPDLDQAITAGRDALSAIPPDHPDRPRYLSNLGSALQTLFEHTGRLADLDQAISAVRDALAATPPDHPGRPRHLSNLAVPLRSRFEHTGHLPDLDEAVAAGREAVATTPPDHPNRLLFLSNLGEGLRARFERTDHLPDLDEAVAAARIVVAATPADHAGRPRLLSVFGAALRSRFERTGHLPDLDEAVAAGREAVATTPADHPNRPRRLSTFCNALRTRFERTGALADLDEAVTAGRDAVTTTPPDHPYRPWRLSIFGETLRMRFNSTGDPADLQDALAAFTDATRVESASAASRMRAALLWGRSAARADLFGSAADGFATAVELLPLVAWHGLARSTREQNLADFSGVAADAAACAIRAGRPEWAVELLEAGRSVLWTQTLSLRTDLTDLAERAPQLASRLDEIRTLLDSPLPGTPEETASAYQPTGRPRPGPERIVADRMHLAREFDDLVGQVRALDGFAHFLAPTPFSELRVAATSGPVVIVNTSPHGCHALLVTGTGVQVVDLPGLTHNGAVEQVNVLLDVLDRAAGHSPPLPDPEPDRRTISDLLGLLWDTVTEPVLNSLGHLDPPEPGASWPRIWWCPTGPLTLLPLHATGRHPGSGIPADSCTVLDRVISSYTPTLAALLRARTVPGTPGGPTLLAIGMPTTPGADDLPAVSEELDRIQARCPITTRLQSPARDHPDTATPEPGTQPTTSRVLTELPRHTWVHLSCHGSQDITDPTQSAFWLTDGPLRITDLIDHRHAGSRELAFLSACHTATGNTQTLDEAIHLAAAMQLLGYRHVIATLWSIYDSPAPAIADTVYTVLTANGTPDAGKAAHAMHHAITALRAQHPADPLTWAPYLHTGP